MNKLLVAPSILSADFSCLGEEIKSVEKAGADWIHIDVMDGHFVPNLTIGAPVVKKIRPITKLPLDVHLMISHPHKYIKDFAEAGADYITIHVESDCDIKETLELISAKEVKAGISLKPKTSLQQIEPYLHLVDLVLVMTVEPGFGGQFFMKDQILKVKEIAEIREKNKFKYLIEVDGGINDKTVGFCKDSDVLVSGSYIFNNDYATSIKSLRTGDIK